MMRKIRHLPFFILAISIFFTARVSAQVPACGSFGLGVPPDACSSGEVCIRADFDQQTCKSNCSNLSTEWVYIKCLECAPRITETPPPPEEPPYVPPAPACNDQCTPGVTQCPLNCSSCRSSNSGGYTCQAAPTPTPTPPSSCNANCDNNSYCQNGNHGCTQCLPKPGGGRSCQPPPPTNTPTNTPVPNTPTPVPACNVRCDDRPQNFCQGGTNRNDNCTVCTTDPNNPNQKTCQPPPPSATPTPVPACNVRCDDKPQDFCTGGSNRADNCTICATDPNNPNQKTCQPPPTATPTPGPACNVRCDDKPQDFCQGGSNRADNCTVCTVDPGNPNVSTCQPEPTATPTLTPTPAPACNIRCDDKPDNFCAGGSNRSDNCTVCTPDPNSGQSTCQTPFDESMCKCDGLEYSNLARGATAIITANGIVEGENTSYAKIPTFTFTMFESTGSTTVDVIGKETIPTTQIEDTPTLARYEATWNLPLPLYLKDNTTYRIQAKPDCSRKSAAVFNAYPTRAVLATVDNQTASFWDRIWGFFANLFNFGESQSPAPGQPTPTPTLTQEQRRQLQLKTFTPAKGIATDNCSFIRFNF